MPSGYHSGCDNAIDASITNTGSASRWDGGLLTPAFSRALHSFSHVRTVSAFKDEIIVCLSVDVLIVAVGGIFTYEFPSSGASALKPSTFAGYFAVLVSPPSLPEMKNGELTSPSFGDSGTQESGVLRFE